MVNSKKVLEKSSNKISKSPDSMLNLATDMGLQVKLMKQFIKLKEELHLLVDKTIDELLQQPLFAAMITWSHNMESLDPNIPEWMKTIFVENLAEILDENGKFFSIAQAVLTNHKAVVDRIRCKRDLDL